MITLALVSGLCMGGMYGLLALGFHITYAVSNTVNFAQGTSLMLGAVLCYLLSARFGWPIGLAIVVALALCALWGVIVERFVVRPFVRAGSNGWLMSTVAVGLILEHTVMFTFGKEPRSLPSSLATTMYDVGVVRVSALQILIPVVGLALAATLHFVSRRTRYGVAMIAVVQNRDAARLMGIPIQTVVTAAFAVSTVFAGIAGVLIAPLFNIHSEMGTLFGLKAFAVAILGGIGNAWGVMVAGLAFGVVEALVTAGLGSGYTQIITFALVIAALAWRPDGLFGRASVRKV